MPIGKMQLIYDATTPADADSVAAFIRSGTGAITSTTISADEALDVASYLRDDAGTLFTGTTVSSDHGLDVNIINDLDIATDLDGVYDNPDNLVPDSIGNIFHTRAAALTEVEQTFRSSGSQANSDAVVAANTWGIDVNSFLMGYNGTTWDRIKSTSGSINMGGNVADDAVDSGNPLKIGFKSTDAALTALSAANDRSDGISDLYRRLYVNKSPNIGIQHSVIAVTGPVAQLDATSLPGRTKIFLQNFGTKDIFLGDSAVSNAGVTRGILLPRGATLELEWGEHIPVYAIAASGSQGLMFFEIA